MAASLLVLLLSFAPTAIPAPACQDIARVGGHRPETGAERGEPVRFGVLLFAICLGALLVGASSSVLRFYPETLISAVSAVVGLSLTQGHALIVLGIIAIASTALVQAGTAMVARSRPPLNGRLMIAAVVLAGVIGAVVAAWEELARLSLVG